MHGRSGRITVSIVLMHRSMSSTTRPGGEELFNQGQNVVDICRTLEV
jgi:hypothetical protein